MSSITEPPPAQVADQRAFTLDRARRIAEAELAWFVGEVEAAGTHRTDGHRTITAWVRSACNASAVQAIHLARLGRALHAYPSFAAEVFAGNIGVGQLQAFARTNANPRVAQLLQHTAPELLDGVVEAAIASPFDDFLVTLARLEALAVMSKTKKTVHASVQVVDIGGLVEGASKGEGLGNKFLSNIRDRKSTRLNSSHVALSRMPSSA